MNIPRLSNSVSNLRFQIPLLLLLLASGVSLQAALPEAAQEPFNKGMSAVEQKDFPLAIRYFNEARRAAPDSTDVLFNLALAEAQEPGRELRAVCWFETYLVLNPGAANAPAVRQQINDLEIRAEGNVRKIIAVLKTLAGKFPSGDSSGISAINQIACIQAESGDLDSANTTVESLPSDNRDSARKGIVDVLARQGRWEDAKNVANSIGYDAQYRTTRSDAFASIADAQIAKGLYPEARQSLSSVAVPYQHLRLLQRLAEELYETGSQDQALALLEEAKQIAATAAAGKDTNLTRLVLQYLAETQAGLGFQADALATLKRVDALLPSKANANNNASIYDALGAHLLAFDYPGAKVLIPRLIDVPGFKYKTQAAISVNDAISQDVLRQFQSVQRLNQAWDLAGLETALSRRSMAPVIRIWGYAALAGLYNKEAQPDKLPEILTGAAAAFAGIGEDPLAKPMAANWIANIADLAGVPAEAQKWRLKALQSLDPLIKNGAQNIGSNWSQLYGSYKNASLAQAIILTALNSDDDKTFHAGVDETRKAFPKCDAEMQSALAGDALWHFWWIDRNFGTASAFIQSIPDAKVRQQALDVHHELQFRKLLATENLSEAALMLAQISDAPAGTRILQKSAKTSLQQSLSQAFADAGDWDNAEKTAALIGDINTQKAAANYLASSRAQGQFIWQSTPQLTSKWHEQQAALSSLTQPVDRVNAYWQLCGFPNADLLEEQRKLMPDYFAAAGASPKPDERLGFLLFQGLAAQRLGLFELERHARALAFSALQAGSSADSASYFFARTSVADYLEQASYRWQDALLLRAIDRLIADGNPAAAVKIMTKLTHTDESVRNHTLMNLWIAQGNLGEARSAYDKIQKDTSANGYAKSYATRDLVRAYVTGTDVASAKALVIESKKLRDNEALESDILKPIALAGEQDWAWGIAKLISYARNRDEAQAAIIGAQAAHSQDAGPARTLLRAMQEDGCSYIQYMLIDALIASGNPQLALKVIPDLHDYTLQANETSSAAAALAHSGDIVAAKKAVETIGNNAQRFAARCRIGVEQAQSGDLDGARTTLLEARKRDPRTSKDMDLETWVNWDIFSALEGKGDFAQAQALALKFQVPALRDSLLSSVAATAIQKKDFTAAQSALAAITNPAIRASTVVDLSAATNDSAQILVLADQMTDPGYQAFALSQALNKAISLGNLAPVLPRLLALPDGAVKAYLLCDVLRAQVYLGLDPGDTSLLPLALKSLAAMPPDVWHTLLLCDLARLAQQISPAQAEILKSHAGTETQALAGADAKIWQQIVADIDAAKIAVQKSSATGTGGSGDSPAQTWASYVEYNLKEPLFTDFKAALEGAASSASDTSGNKAWMVFSNVSQLAEQLLNKLKEIHDLSAKNAKGR